MENFFYEEKNGLFIPAGRYSVFKILEMIDSEFLLRFKTFETELLKFKSPEQVADLFLCDIVEHRFDPTITYNPSIPVAGFSPLATEGWYEETEAETPGASFFYQNLEGFFFNLCAYYPELIQNLSKREWMNNFWSEF